MTKSVLVAWWPDLPPHRAIRVLDCSVIRFIGGFSSGKVMAKLKTGHDERLWIAARN